MMDEIKTESTVTIVEEDFENDNDLSRLSESEVSEVLKKRALENYESKTKDKETVELLKKIIEDKKDFFLGKVYVGGVTAGIVTEDGVIYTSNCVSGHSGLEVCAERVALMNAINHGHTKFKKVMAVTNGYEIIKPCGVCLEFLKQINGDEVEVYLDIDKLARVKDLI